MNAPTGNYPGSMVRDYYRKKGYEDSTQNEDSSRDKLQRKRISDKFKAMYGRGPSPEELEAINRVDAGNDREMQIQTAMKGMGWSEQNGYMVPPSATTQGLITPEEHQELGELYKILESPQKQLELGDSKLANLIESGNTIIDKLNKAGTKAKIDRIEHPGKYIPDNEDQGYQDSSSTWKKQTIEPIAMNKSVNVPSQTMDMQGGQAVQKDFMGNPLSSDPIIRMQQQLLEQTKTLKQPYIEWGNEAMSELRDLLDEDSLTPDGSPIENYQFKELQDDFQIQDYGPQRPEITKFQPGEAPEMYIPEQAYQASQYKDFAPRDAYMRQEFEDHSQFRDVVGRPEELEYNEFQPQQSFSYDQHRPGEPQLTQFGKYEPEERPQERFISRNFDTQMYQQDGQAPEVFRAGEAPKAEYYEPGKGPEKAYQAEEFDVKRDPGYQLRLSEAMRGVEASGAARGQQLSGATLKALQDRAAGLASQETDSAYRRYADRRNFEAGQEREDYGRGQRYQDQIKDATRFKTEDEYRRYLDNVGIRRDEQQQTIQQWNRDRDFGASQNREAFLREQAEKDLGRALNQDEFNRWLQTDGQRFQQYTDHRNFKYGRYRDQVGDYRDDRNFQYGQHRDERGDRWQEHVYDTTYRGDRYDKDMANYKDGRNFAYGRYRDDKGDRWKEYVYGTTFDQAQDNERYNRERDQYLTNRENYLWGEDQKVRANQENYNRMRALYGDKTDAYRYGTNLGQSIHSNYQNAMQNAYDKDRAYHGSQQDKRWQQNLGNLAMRDRFQDREYGQLQDIYNMDREKGMQKYNTLSGIIGQGLNAQNATVGQQGNYANFLTDWNVNQTNRQDALNKAKKDKAWNWANFFSNILT